MAVETSTDSWSTGTLLAQKELWQNHGPGSVYVTADASPVGVDGVRLLPGEGHVFPTGVTVKIKSASKAGATVTRTIAA